MSNDPAAKPFGRPSPPGFAVLFRSRTQGLLLTQLMLSAHPMSVTQLAEATAVAKVNILRDLQRLAAAGIVSTEIIGRERFAKVIVTGAWYELLEDMCLLTFGPTLVLAEELADLPGAEQVYIFGSWARRYGGEHGPKPNDIDVLIIGEPDSDALFSAEMRIRRRLPTPVNIITASAQRWSDPGAGVLASIKAGPRYQVIPYTETPFSS